MSDEEQGSVTTWIDLLKQGDHDAVRKGSGNATLRNSSVWCAVS